MSRPRLMLSVKIPYSAMKLSDRQFARWQHPAPRVNAYDFSSRLYWRKIKRSFNFAWRISVIFDQIHYYCASQFGSTRSS